ncbi:MAG TPA: hypothetical protein PK765_04275 [bacterium]|nr:hypothetical protein [bacterium]
MTTSILRLLALTLMSSACIRFYYSGSSVFPRTFLSEWWWWVAGIVGLYIAYKTWIVLTKKKTLEISALGVIAAFLIFLFGLSFAHASFAPDTAIAGVISGGFAIFGRTLFSCILPLGLVWLWWALGRQILRTTGFLAEATADRMLGFFMPTSV